MENLEGRVWFYYRMKRGRKRVSRVLLWWEKPGHFESWKKESPEEGLMARDFQVPLLRTPGHPDCASDQRFMDARWHQQRIYLWSQLLPDLRCCFRGNILPSKIWKLSIMYVHLRVINKNNQNDNKYHLFCILRKCEEISFYKNEMINSYIGVLAFLL